MAKEKKIGMVILGLLCHENLTGYDIKKRIDSVVSLYWKGSFGSIYPALKEMVGQGFVTKSDTSVGGRERITYHITEQGRERFADWLSEENSESELRELKYEMLLKLFFGGSLDKDISLRNIVQFEDRVKKDLDAVKGYTGTLEKITNDRDHLYYYLTASFAEETYEAYLRWCEKAKEMLK